MFGKNNPEPVSMIESSNPRFNEPAKPKSGKKLLIIGISIMAVFLIVSAVIIIGMGGKKLAKGDDEDYSALAPEGKTDDTDEPDQLNSHLAGLIKDAPHADYESKSEEINKQYSSTFSLARSAISTQAFSAKYIEEKFDTEKLDVMNANIINYYLDQGYIVAISATGTFPFSDQETAVVIFGAKPQERVFYTCYYSAHDNYNTADLDETASKHLFDAIEGNEKFYVLKGVKK